MGEIFEQVQPSTPLEWTGERLTTGAGGQVEIEHLHRYMMARDYCRGLDVLDVASGEGYGTALLGQVARSATGVEISAEAAGHAAAQYGGGSVRFLQGDARKIPLADQAVDVVVSFETIEHFYDHDAFMSEIRRVLRPGGRLIISSPDRDIYSPPGREPNPFHVRELTRDEFARLLAASFQHVRMVGQRPMVGSVLLADGEAAAAVTIERRGPTRFERSDGLPRAIYLVAIASDAPVPLLPNSVFIDSDEVGGILARAQAHGPASAALEQMRQRAEAAEAAYHGARAELDGAKAQIEAAAAAGEKPDSPAEPALPTIADAESDARIGALRDELRDACSQRDVARLALRRAAVFAENGWSARFTEMHRLRNEALTHAEGLDRLAAALRQECAQRQSEAEHWRLRYESLRGRVDTLLRRVGALPASRLVPRSARRYLLERFAGKQS